MTIEGSFPGGLRCASRAARHTSVALNRKANVTREWYGGETGMSTAGKITTLSLKLQIAEWNGKVNRHVRMWILKI